MALPFPLSAHHLLLDSSSMREGDGVKVMEVILGGGQKEMASTKTKASP